MSLPDRKDDEVRRLLDSSYTPLPADLAARASTRGARLLRRRHQLHVTLWTLGVIAAILFTAWAVTTQPWSIPEPSPTPVYTW